MKINSRRRRRLGERAKQRSVNERRLQFPSRIAPKPIFSILLTADQMFTPNLNEKIAQFNLVMRHLATVLRHLCAGVMPGSAQLWACTRLDVLNVRTKGQI